MAEVSFRIDPIHIEQMNRRIGEYLGLNYERSTLSRIVEEYAELEAGFGARPAFVREGGSIGAVLSMSEAWRTPITLLGLSLPEDGYHGPNESYAWWQARGGMLTFVRYFERLAALGRRS